MTDVLENQVQTMFNYSIRGHLYCLKYYPNTNNYIFRYRSVDDYEPTEFKIICFDSICVYEHSKKNCRIVGLHKSFVVSFMFDISIIDQTEAWRRICECFTNILLKTCTESEMPEIKSGV